MNVKKRKCIGCQNIFDRNYMFRIMKKSDTQEIILNPSNKDFGRSIYICKNPQCIEKAFKRKNNTYLKSLTPEKLKSML